MAQTILLLTPSLPPQGLKHMPEKVTLKKPQRGTSLVVEWLRLHAPNSGSPGSIPGQGTKPRMPQLKAWHATTKGPVRGNEDPEGHN